MNRQVEDSTVRKYLLGELEGEEPLRLIEERLMLDPEVGVELEDAEDDLIDDYVRGALTAVERNDFERRFLTTRERREKLVFASAFNKRLPRPSAVPPIQRPAPAPPQRFAWLRWPKAPAYVTAAALALVVLAAGLIVWRVIFRRSDVTEGLVALRTAYGDLRPVESRVTGLGYGRLAEMRGAEDGQVDALTRDRAERLLRDAQNDEPGPASLHALGRFYLYERKFDEAVRLLEAAAADAPGDARLQNDLGAALLERGKDARACGDDGKAKAELGRSLERFERALALDPSLTDALFNRAIVYENLRLDAKAEAEWRAYLVRDSSTPWADEARQRLRRLEEQRKRGAVEHEKRFEEFAEASRAGDAERAWGALGRSRSAAGNGLVERLIDAFLEHGAAGRASEADEALGMLSFAGVVEERKSGDRFTADLASFYRSAGQSRLKTVARARALMREATERFYRSESKKAVKLFAEARREFERSGDTCEALLAEQWEGLCYLRVPDVKKSTATFERLVEASEASGYAALRARALQALCDASTSADEPSRAREYAGRALALSEKIEYGENVVRCWQFYTSMHRQNRSYTESLAASRRGLGLALENAPDPKLVWPFYAEAGLDFSDLGLHAAAFAFEHEALRLALESGWPVIVERSYARLGQVYLRARDHGEAVRYASLAVEKGSGIADEETRNNVVANALLRLGHVYRETQDYARAVESYDRSLGLYKGLGLKVYDLEAHRGKLLTYEALGDDASAERELGVLLARLEEYRGKMREVQSRDSFFDTSQSVYDAAADFAYTRRGDPRAAFDFAERSHARTLLDLMRSNAEAVEGLGGLDVRPSLTTEPLALEEIMRRMPEGAQILQYHVLEDKLLAWLVSRKKFEPLSLGVGRGELSAKVAAYVQLVLRGAEGGRESAAAKELYQILVAPLEASLDADKQVCIVADKVLHGLPFASLVSPASGRYLFEERTLVHSPGASVFVVESEAAREKARAVTETLLSVGDPSFNRVRYERLSALPSAGREAREVAALYGARPLVGEGAGEEEVLRGMREADVIHLASHYVADEKSPVLSRLLLAHRGRRGAGVDEPADDDASDGELQAFEVYRMKLPRARLVVLSACQTSSERVYRGEGAVGIARPFIAAGAPLVIASLWPVESGPTADLMISFHRRRKLDGLPTAEAFRRAQLDMLSSPDHQNRQPKHWAAFTVTGGYADF